MIKARKFRYITSMVIALALLCFNVSVDYANNRIFHVVMSPNFTIT